MKIISAISYEGFCGRKTWECIVEYSGEVTGKAILTDIEYKKHLMFEKLSDKLDKETIKELDSLIDDINTGAYEEGCLDGASAGEYL